MNISRIEEDESGTEKSASNFRRSKTIHGKKKECRACQSQ